MRESGRVFEERIRDLVSDPRLPQGAFMAGWRWVRHRRRFETLSTGTRKNLAVALTFDVEDDYRKPGICAASRKWLPTFIDWAGDRKATLYVQGSTVRTLSDELRTAQAQHELGLHGLYHEVWGTSKWWQYSLGYSSLPLSEKERRLKESLLIMEESGLRRPRTFRAPYLNIDEITLRMLFAYGFTSDSSSAAYYGTLPSRPVSNRILQIPVTSCPVPQVKLRGIAWFSFSQLILPTIAGSSEDGLLKMVRCAVNVQESLGIPPHVVFLAHPWEFYPSSGLSHTGPNTWEYLERFLDLLGFEWILTYTTISDIGQLIQDAFGVGKRASVSGLVGKQGEPNE